MVEIRGVGKRFGALAAVDDVSLDIGEGRFVTLLGPSGCGKTTLLRLIGGLERPDSGTIRIAGRPIGSYRGPDRPTRTVFQSYALFPHLTVAGNVAYGLRLKGMRGREIARLVAAELELVGLADKAGAYPGALSGGQQQRVALARALVTRPLVLLLDEPLAALDLKLRQRLGAELKARQREAGITFIHVTHDQGEALALSDEVVVLRAGRIDGQGAPAEVYGRPRSRHVALFVGDGTIVPGTVTARDGDRSRVLTALGPWIVASAGHARPADGRVDLLIRPEQVRLGPGPANTLHGRVLAILYRGTDALAEIAVGGERLQALVPADRVGAAPVGAAVTVHVPPDAVWAMAAAGTG